MSSLSGSASGTGIKGAEDERVKASSDPRIKKRIYFYPSTGNGTLPRPEAGLGSHVYTAKLENLHDASKPSPEANDIAKLAQARVAKGEHPSNAYESSVLDSGFHGYKTDNLAVVLGKDQPVKYAGTSVGKTFKDPVFDTKEKAKSVFGGIANKEGEHTSSTLTPTQVSFWQKHKESLQKAAPSMRMQYGKISIKAEHLPNLQKELSEKHPDHPL